MCAVSSGLDCGLRLWFRWWIELAAHRAWEGQDADNSVCSASPPLSYSCPHSRRPWVWAWPVLFLVRESHHPISVFPEGNSV